MSRTISPVKYFLILFLFVCFGILSAKDLYVSLSGNDNWSGTHPDPNASSTDGPFATIDRARKEIRALRTADQFPEEGITIHIRGGKYSFGGTLRFDEMDGGTEDAPVVLRPYQDETVQFLGGLVINSFTSISDSSVLARIDSSGREHILQANLKSFGIQNFPDIANNGPRIELLFRNEPMTIARYPNEGWLRIQKVPQYGDSLIHGRSADHYGWFIYATDRYDKWATFDDIWMHGYWVWDWSDEYQKIKTIDTEIGGVYIEPPYHRYGFKEGARFYFLNILEELDSPGEWYLDRQTGILYFWPPEEIRQDDVYISLLDSVMIELNETANVHIDNIRFEGTVGTAVVMHGGSMNQVAGCQFSNIMNDVIIIDGGTHNGVRSCDFSDIGARGIMISGGDRLTLTSAGNYAVNNHIHQFARIQRTYRPAISLSGVGNMARHNVLHEAPHMAIYFSGNEHVIEFNEIYNVAQETGDVGAIYSGRDWTWRGNKIRFNYLHDIHGPGALGAIGVYLDDALCGTTIYGNVFYKSSMAILIGGGRDNLVENNVFVSCNPSVHVDARGLNWASDYIAPGGGWHMYEKLQAVHYDQPPYSTFYPELATILNGNPAVPEGNRILHNIHYLGKWLDFNPANWDSAVTVKDNLITFLDPGFISLDPEHLNLQLNNDSPAFDIGFKKIPMDSIGLYTDEYRTYIPTEIKESDCSSKTPGTFSLRGYPNPFNHSTAISWNLEKPAYITLAIYDILGRNTRILTRNRLLAGHHTLAWDGNDENGTPVSSGLYFAVLKTINRTENFKLILMR